MGVVYKAEDLKLKRIVALKFLPPGVQISQDLARFQQEAEAISSLNHPNIATIYEVDDAGGKKFLALEFIPGGTLKSKLESLKADNKALPIPDVLTYGIQVADALAHAHRHQIIHRDIKSDNVMLTEGDAVKLTDFGLAKGKGAVQLTRAGSTIGTLGYVAPEQLIGEDVDHRADLFSLGAVLYEIATSRMPFRGEHEAALTYSIANEDPIPPRSLRPDIPPPLEDIVIKCLEKDRSRRYQSADEIAADLRKLQQGDLRRVKRVRHIPRKLVWGIASVGIVAALYFLLPFSRPVKADNSKTVAVLPFANLSGSPDDEYFSDGMTEDIMTQLSKIGDLKVISRTSVMQYKGTRKTGTEIGRDLKAGVILEGSVRRAGDQVRVTAQLIDAATDENLWAENYDREFKQVFAIQSEIAQKIAAALHARLSPLEKQRIDRPVTSNPDAYNLLLRGRYLTDRGDREGVAKSIDLFNQAIATYPGDARLWASLGDAYRIQADFGFAEIREGYEKARQAAQKAVSLDENLANGHAVLAASMKSLDWNWSGADAEYRKALDLEPGNASTINGIASLASTLGKFDEAVSLQRKAIELDPVQPLFYWSLGVMYLNSNRFDESIGAFRKILELNPNYPFTHVYIGDLHLLRGHPDSAFAEYALEKEELYRLTGLAMAYYATGRMKEADNALAKCIQEYQTVVAYQIAEIYAFRGDGDAAMEWLNRAYTLRDGGLTIMKGDPLLKKIEKDPRFVAFLQKMNLPP